jgi:aminopeptidase N
MQPRKGFLTFGAMLAWSLLLPLSAGWSQEASTRSGSDRAAAGGGTSTRKPRPFATADTPKKVERLRLFDIRHVKGELTLDPQANAGAGEVRGTVTHTVAPIYPGLGTLTIDCAKELKVAKVVTGPKEKPRPCTFEARGETLVVTLDRTYAANEVFELAVTYAGTPKQGLYLVPADPADPGRPVCYWTQGEADETHHWLPCYDFPNDRATSEMIVTVPRPLRVLSNGKLVATKDNPDGTVTDHWRMDVPHVSYLISLVATEFTVAHDTLGDLPVDYYVLKNHDEATARRAFGKTPKMIAFYEQVTGQKYPYPKYAQAVVPEFTQGGMENISATTMNEFLLGDATSFLERDSDSVVAHELAHQWFGDLLTCRDWPHVWLNEGFASYFDPLWTEHDEGDDAFRLQMDGALRGYLMTDSFVRRAIVEPRYRDTMQLFDGVTYSKGACVLHTLRGLVGDDAWWRGIKQYVAKHREQVVETDDFRRAMEAASGRDLTWFFDQWVFHGGHPELKAKWRYEPEDRSLRLEVEQIQNVDDLTPLFRLPTTVEFDEGATPRSVFIVIDGRTHEFVIPCRVAPKMVRIDPKGWIVKELDFDKTPAAWVYQLEHAPDGLGRVEAARALAKRKDDDTAVRALAQAWSRVPSTPVRQTLVQLLTSNAAKHRAALIAAAHDKSARVRATALQGLSGLKADPELEALFRATWSDPKEGYGARRTALRTLARWKVKDRDALLTAGLATPSDRHLIEGVALDLVLEGGGRTAREAAIKYSRPGQPLALRRPAVFALGRMAQDDPQVQSALIELVGEPSRALRRSVLMQLSGKTYKGAVEALEAARKRETSAPSREALESAIASIKAKESKPATPAASTPAPSPAPAPGPAPAAATAAQTAELEKKIADLENQARALRSQVEALKKTGESPRPAPPTGAK